MTLTLRNCSHFKLKNHIVALFSKCVVVVPMKCDRDIARFKEGLVTHYDFDLEHFKGKKIALNF